VNVLPDSLLVSCPNQGGLFALAKGRVVHLSSMDGTGLAVAPGRTLRALQVDGAATIGIFSRSGFDRVRLAEDTLDIHDLLCVDGRVFVACTELNAVLELDADFREIRRWTFAGEPDSIHLNCLCLYKGRLLASVFGNFTTHRGYKGNTAGRGEVRDVITGQTLIADLSQPHTLQVDGDELILCNSESGELLFYLDAVCTRRIMVGGYVRGLAVGTHHYYVGISLSRNVDPAAPGMPATAEIVAIERVSGHETARFAMPAREIYDLRILDENIGLDTLAIACCDEMNAAYDALDHELTERNVVLSALQQEHEKIATWARSLDSELADRNTLLGSLQKELTKLGLRVDMLNRELVTLRDQHDQVLRSRSWALTRPLRAMSMHLRGDHGAMAAVVATHGGRKVMPLPARVSAAAPTTVDEQASDPSAAALQGIAALNFPDYHAPLVSILIAAYGHLDITLACLSSIAAHPPKVPGTLPFTHWLA
jgi:hypothetical protein